MTDFDCASVVDTFCLVTYIKIEYFFIIFQKYPMEVLNNTFSKFAEKH